MRIPSVICASSPKPCSSRASISRVATSPTLLSSNAAVEAPLSYRPNNLCQKLLERSQPLVPPRGPKKSRYSHERCSEGFSCPAEYLLPAARQQGAFVGPAPGPLSIGSVSNDRACRLRYLGVYRAR